MASVQDTSSLITTIITIGAVISTIAYAVAKFFDKRATAATEAEKKAIDIHKDAMDSLNTTVTALKEQNQIQADQIAQQTKKVAELSGTVDTLKNIPLVRIEKHMADTNQILEALLPLIPQTIERALSGEADK